MVRFEIAVTYYCAGNTNNDRPIWLEIESAVEICSSQEDDTTPEIYKKFSNLLHSSTGLSATVESTAASPNTGKAISFEEKPSIEVKISESEISPVPYEEALDLCSIEDVCDHFQKQQELSRHHTCIGYFNDTCVQRFYQPCA